MTQTAQNDNPAPRAPRPATLFEAKGFDDLRSFTGTETYWRSGFVYKGRALSYTDGVKYIAEKAGAYWLVDLVLAQATEIYCKHASPARDRFHDVLVCELTVNDESDTAVLEILDGDRNVLYTQTLLFTDFPAAFQVIWVKQGIAMLPSEY